MVATAGGVEVYTIHVVWGYIVVGDGVATGRIEADTVHYVRNSVLDDGVAIGGQEIYAILVQGGQNGVVDDIVAAGGFKGNAPAIVRCSVVGDDITVAGGVKADTNILIWAAVIVVKVVVFAWRGEADAPTIVRCGVIGDATVLGVVQNQSWVRIIRETSHTARVMQIAVPYHEILCCVPYVNAKSKTCTIYVVVLDYPWISFHTISTADTMSGIEVCIGVDTEW